MRAIQMTQFGGPHVLELAEVAKPQPGTGEVLVRMEVAGVNYADIGFREGARGGPLPVVPGREGAGTIAQLGPGVSGLTEGERVAFDNLGHGCYAEYALVRADLAVPVPDHISSEIASTMMVQGLTAHYLSHSSFALAPGHACLIHAGAGGVGQLLIQIARAKGARVLATVGSQAKKELAESLGADHAILYRERDFADAVADLTGGAGLDVVYDSVGRETLERSFACLKRLGTVIHYGAASGAV